MANMKKILIIGAGFLQSFVIQKAKQMGYYVLAVDANPDAVGFVYTDAHAVINIVDEEACLKYAMQEKIDGVLTAATDYGVLTASYIAQKMNLPGLHYETAKLIKNKYQVRKRLFENNVDDAQQAYEVSEETDLECLKNKLQYPVMVKPCDGSGSRGASRVDDASQLEQSCQYAIAGSLTHKAEIEDFIVGREYGVESLVANGEIHVLAVMRKKMTMPPNYAELGHMIPSGLSDILEQRVRDCVTHAIQVLGINFGSVNMDLIITDSGKIYIVDIGARMGGNMIGPCVVPYGTGIDYVANMLRNTVADPLDWSRMPHSAVATRLLAFREGVVKKVPVCDSEDNNLEVYHHMSVGQRVNKYRTNLDGLGYIIARAETVEVAEENAQKLLAFIGEECIVEE